jgi:hypothetical protein
VRKFIALTAAVLLSTGLSAASQAAATPGQDPQTPPAAKPADKPATIAGKWNGSVDPGNGPTYFVLDLKLDGKKVTGSLTGDYGTSAVDGEFADNKLTFSITLDTPQGAFTVAFTGTLKDDAITGTADLGQMGSFAFKAERAKDKDLRSGS